MNGRDIMLGGLDAKSEQLSKIQNMVITGCGTSKFAGEFGAKIMRDLFVFDSVQVVDSAEMSGSCVPPSSVCLAVSQSGETKDVVRALDISEKRGAMNMAVCNAVGSQIARKTGLGVYLNAGREHAVASTKAFTTQVTVMALIGLWFHKIRNVDNNDHVNRKMGSSTMSKTGITWQSVDDLIEALQRLPISLGMARSQQAKCKKVAEYLTTKSSMFILGKGRAEPIASEGALKIKEMCYLHAEGYSGGALKHGPFALIEDENGREGSTPIIMLILNDQHAAHMRIAAQEVKARGAKVC
jgi:glucosamine--fructose-6-phosphate aminotransferase (isomerizing)